MLPRLETPNLILRNWRPEDMKPFAVLNADPRVMEFFPAVLSEAESEAMFHAIQEKMKKNGFCFWALECKASAEFIGFAGLNVPNFDARFTPCVEIGWRLAFRHWGKGYAPEAAGAALEFGFRGLGLSEIVSFTSAINLRSRRVMEKIGMVYDPTGDFEHPSLPPKHRLSWHVLYRMAAAQWQGIRLP